MEIHHLWITGWGIGKLKDFVNINYRQLYSNLMLLLLLLLPLLLLLLPSPRRRKRERRKHLCLFTRFGKKYIMSNNSCWFLTNPFSIQLSKPNQRSTFFFTLIIIINNNNNVIVNIINVNNTIILFAPKTFRLLCINTHLAQDLAQDLANHPRHH